MLETKEKEKKYSTEGPVISKEGAIELGRLVYTEWVRCMQERQEKEGGVK